MLSASQIDLSKLDKRLFEIELGVACDVDNPLYGDKGVAFVYAQKGASREMVEKLDLNLRYFAKRVKEQFQGGCFL